MVLWLPDCCRPETAGWIVTARWALIAVAMAIGPVAAPATADQSGQAGAEETIGGPDVTGRLGAIAFFAPEFEGASDYTPTVFPLLELTVLDRYFLDGQRGLGMTILKAPQITVATSVGYHFGRAAGDSDALTGLPDINGGAQALAFVTLTPFPEATVDLTFRRGLTGGDDGTTIELAVSRGFRLARRWFARAELSTTYADGEYMDKYFSVSSNQAMASGLSAFEATGGFKDVDLSGSVMWRFSGAWSAFGRLSVKQLLGDAADSSIVSERGNATQGSVGLGLSYNFSF